MTDESNRTPSQSYRYANRRIEDLLNKLKGKGVCGCCTGRAMVLHAAMLCEETMGSRVAAELFSEIVEEARKHNIPAPNYDAKH
jgi:hypothetical protein